MIKKKNLGLTLIEVLIALIIGSFTIAGIYYSYNIFTVNFDSMKSKIQLNRDLRFALNSISRDIRNAGYHSTLPDINGISQSPFPTMNYKIIVRKNTYMNLNSRPGRYQSGVNDVLELIYDIDKNTRIRVSYAQLNNGFLARRVSRCLTANCYDPDLTKDYNQYRYDEAGYYDFNGMGNNLINGFKVALFDKNGKETNDSTKAKLIRVSVLMWGLGVTYKANVERTFNLEDYSRKFSDKLFRDLITTVTNPRNL